MSSKELETDFVKLSQSILSEGIDDEFLEKCIEDQQNVNFSIKDFELELQKLVEIEKMAETPLKNSDDIPDIDEISSFFKSLNIDLMKAKKSTRTIKKPVIKPMSSSMFNLSTIDSKTLNNSVFKVPRLPLRKDHQHHRQQQQQQLQISRNYRDTDDISDDTCSLKSFATTSISPSRDNSTISQSSDNSTTNDISLTKKLNKIYYDYNEFKNLYKILLEKLHSNTAIEMQNYCKEYERLAKFSNDLNKLKFKNPQIKNKLNDDNSDDNINAFTIDEENQVKLIDNALNTFIFVKENEDNLFECKENLQHDQYFNMIMNLLNDLLVTIPCL